MPKTPKAKLRNVLADVFEDNLLVGESKVDITAVTSQTSSAPDKPDHSHLAMESHENQERVTIKETERNDSFDLTALNNVIDGILKSCKKKKRDLKSGNVQLSAVKALPNLDKENSNEAVADRELELNIPKLPDSAVKRNMRKRKNREIAKFSYSILSSDENQEHHELPIEKEPVVVNKSSSERGPKEAVTYESEQKVVENDNTRAVLEQAQVLSKLTVSSAPSQVNSALLEQVDTCNVSLQVSRTSVSCTDSDNTDTSLAAEERSTVQDGKSTKLHVLEDSPDRSVLHSETLPENQVKSNHESADTNDKSQLQGTGETSSEENSSFDDFERCLLQHKSKKTVKDHLYVKNQESKNESSDDSDFEIFLKRQKEPKQRKAKPRRVIKKHVVNTDEEDEKDYKMYPKQSKSEYKEVKKHVLPRIDDKNSLDCQKYIKQLKPEQKNKLKKYRPADNEDDDTDDSDSEGSLRDFIVPDEEIESSDFSTETSDEDETGDDSVCFHSLNYADGSSASDKDLQESFTKEKKHKLTPPSAKPGRQLANNSKKPSSSKNQQLSSLLSDSSDSSSLSSCESGHDVYHSVLSEKSPPKLPFVTPRRPLHPPSHAATSLGVRTIKHFPTAKPYASTTKAIPRASFLKSLLKETTNRDPEALKFVANFKQNKEELVLKLFKLYNKTVFEEKLPEDLPIKWSSRLLKTAGCCRYKSKGSTRTAEIELSEKVCDTADRVRDTLIHELCHAAVWLIVGVHDHHGRYWQYYARRAGSAHPEIPVVDRCHSYDIKSKYIYKCSGCGDEIPRHSKSINTEKQVCARCKGQFKLLRNNGSFSVASRTPVTPKPPSGFALFVKDNYGSVKKSTPRISHKETMQILSAQYSSKKQKNDQL